MVVLQSRCTSTRRRWWARNGVHHGVAEGDLLHGRLVEAHQAVGHPLSIYHGHPSGKLVVRRRMADARVHIHVHIHVHVHHAGSGRLVHAPVVIEVLEVADDVRVG